VRWSFGRVLAVVALVALVGLGIHQLRQATLTVHEDVDPDTRLEIVLDASVNGEAEHEALDMVRGLAFLCELEVHSSIVGAEVMELDDGRFRYVLEPSLDNADRRQLRGCLQDARVDHLLASVDEMRELPS